ncbi:hypothetical protein [Streptomyces sp. CoH27]|uniref:hypothetical protein n=1 Tax=Streptomyces sp. CoH27 TaxID=2875763 RepID=UPI001CD1B0DB|nr:hypothetical protein [Streptomyces sp. CoH27]
MVPLLLAPQPGYGAPHRPRAGGRPAPVRFPPGLAALFVGLLGFGLVKGRTGVGELASPYDALVGGALLLCLLCGTLCALLLLLLRAAHGAPTVVRLPTGIPASATALRLGDGPRILVPTPSGVVCGDPVRTADGLLLVRTDTGESTIRLDRAEALAAVGRCPGVPAAQEGRAWRGRTA